MPWLGVTLQMDTGAAEDFGDALLEAGAQSVALEDLDCPQATVQAVLRRDSDPAALVRAASAALGLADMPGFSIRQIDDADWVRATQAQFAPVAIGGRLWIGATWHPAPAGKVAVRIDPGLAFGTGTHPTTRLALAFLERSITGGERVLDYGCGSGILAIAAAKLGAACVHAVDVDPQAVHTAAANARANGVEMRSALPDALAAGTYDIVVANILAQPLIVLAPLLAARAGARGRIALSGILQPQAAEVAHAYREWFDVGLQGTEENWALLVGVRR